MRLLIFVTVCLLFAPSPRLAAAEDAAKLPQTLIAKESYSIGYQVGLSMKTDGVEVDFENLLQGLHDSIDGKEPRLHEEEMKKLIVALKGRTREFQMKQLQELIVKNAAESGKFLEENRKKDGVRSTESGLQYKVLKEGEGPSPMPEEFVTVNYRGMFMNGREFDSSYAKGEPQTFQTDGVIKGWTEALQMMKTGSKWRIFVPPHLAYGRGGLGERIPPNTVLVFDIELLAIGRENKESTAGK